MGVSSIRFDRKRPVVMLHGFLESLQGLQSDAAPDEDFVGIGAGRERPAEKHGGLWESPARIGADTQDVQRVEIVGFALQDGAAKVLGLAELPRLE
jgi:hypothetical protein